jgi:hypothetical protein
MHFSVVSRLNPSLYGNSGHPDRSIRKEVDMLKILLCSFLVLVGCAVDAPSESKVHSATTGVDAGSCADVICSAAVADPCCDSPPVAPPQRQEISIPGAAGRAAFATYVSGGKLLITSPTQVSYFPQLTVGTRVVGVTLRMRGNGTVPSVRDVTAVHVSSDDDITTILSYISVVPLTATSADIIMPTVSALLTAGSTIAVEFNADPGVEIANVRLLLE